jgi:predicted nucleic acid-binding protein
MKMLLVDTSVWVSHLREGNAELIKLLINGEVMIHPFIVGELACGNLNNRAEILSLLQALPMAIPAEHREALELIEINRLTGKGLGYVDVHLLAAALLMGVPLWTLDKKLAAVAGKLKISY